MAVGWLGVDGHGADVGVAVGAWLWGGRGVVGHGCGVAERGYGVGGQRSGVAVGWLGVSGHRCGVDRGV